MTIPIASITRDRAGTHGGMAMARELMAAHEVEVFWPGTGPIDPAERAALKELYRDGIGFWNWDYGWLGTSGNMYRYARFHVQDTALTASGARHTFLADVNDTLDPCGGSGDPNSRLEGITCIGGHVINIDLSQSGHTQLQFVPASISQFRHLRSFYHIFKATVGGGDATTVVLPDSFGDLSMLVSLTLCGHVATVGQALHLPGTVDRLQNLAMLEIGGFGINGSFPSAFFSLPAMTSVTLHNLPLPELPSVSSMSRLSTFSLKANGLTGPAPSFKGLAKLETVSFAGNTLTGGNKDMFDGCLMLEEVDVAGNALSCDLFTFRGCLNLTTIKAARNKLTGGIPAEYATLNSVELLDVSYNSIGGAGDSLLTPLKHMVALVKLDLSHNRLVFQLASDGGSTMSVWVQGFLGFELRFLDLSHNNISCSGSFSENVCSTYGNLVHVDLSHNSIHGYFATQCLSYNFDFSYNQMAGVDMYYQNILQTGTLSQQVQWATMKLDHQSPSNGLPQRFAQVGVPYATIDASFKSLDWSQSIMVPGFDFEAHEYPAGSGEYPFTCPRWHSRLFPELEWDMDPVVYDFHGGSTAALRLLWISNTTDKDR
jgi:hypothetical protein